MHCIALNVGHTNTHLKTKDCVNKISIHVLRFQGLIYVSYF